MSVPETTSGNQDGGGVSVADMTSFLAGQDSSGDGDGGGGDDGGEADEAPVADDEEKDDDDDGETDEAPVADADGDDEEKDDEEKDDEEKDDEEKDDEEKKKDDELTKSKKRRLAAQAKARESKVELETTKAEAKQLRADKAQVEQTAVKSMDLVRRSHTTQRTLEASLAVKSEEAEYWRQQAVAKGVPENPYVAEMFKTKLEMLQMKGAQEAQTQTGDVVRQQGEQAALARIRNSLTSAATQFKVDPQRLLYRYRESLELNDGKSLEQLAQEMSPRRRPTERETRKRNQNSKSQTSPVTLETGGGADTVFEPTVAGMRAFLEATSKTG